MVVSAGVRAFEPKCKFALPGTMCAMPTEYLVDREREQLEVPQRLQRHGTDTGPNHHKLDPTITKGVATGTKKIEFDLSLLIGFDQHAEKWWSKN